MKYAIILFFLLISIFPFAQQKTSRPLEIRSLIPNVTIQASQNTTGSIISFAAMKDKLIILDFWASWCSACRSQFPKMQALQNKYPKKLKILLVNADLKDTKEKIETILGRIRNAANAPFPLESIVQDTVLKSLFPHKIIPHYVWIKNDTVIGITPSESVNEENIEAVLKNQPAKFIYKNENQTYDINQPLLVSTDNIGSESIHVGSAISKRVDGLGNITKTVKDKEGKVLRKTLINKSILQLYKEAFQIYMPSNRIILDVKDKNKLHSSDSLWGEWKYKNTYCYEYVGQPTSIINLKAKMQYDLTSYFGYEGQLEKKELYCFVIKKRNLTIPSSVTKQEMNLGEKGQTNYIHGLPISALIDYLNNNWEVPYIDETNDSTLVNIDIPWDQFNKQGIETVLKKKGYTLTLEKRTMDVFTLKETDNLLQDTISYRANPISHKRQKSKYWQ